MDHTHRLNKRRRSLHRNPITLDTTHHITQETSIINNMASINSQDPVHLARTLRRIKRRLLLEQCGAPLPQRLQNTPPRPTFGCSSTPRPTFSRSMGSAMPYALQNKPQALLRSDSGDSNDSTIGTSKLGQQTRRVFSQVAQASPSME